MGRDVALGANRSCRHCARIDDLEERRSKRGKAVVSFCCSLGYLSAGNIFFPCQNTLLCYKCSFISASRKTTVCLVLFLLPLSFCKHTHTHTHRRSLCLRSQSPSPHKPLFIRVDLQYFLPDDTGGPGKQIAAPGIYQISLGIWHLWVLFFLPCFA